MTDIRLKSDPALDRKIAACTDTESIREILKTHFAALGVIGRDRGSDWGARLLPGQQPEPAPQVSVPVNPANEPCWRAFYPHGNDRYEIYAATEQELDVKEAQIRSLFSK